MVVLVIAADEPISQQDVKIASYAKRRLKEIMVVFNKWDLVKKDTHTAGRYIADLHREMPFLQFAPVQFISAKTHQRINRIMETLVKIEEEAQKRIPTSELNRFMAMSSAAFLAAASASRLACASRKNCAEDGRCGARSKPRLRAPGRRFATRTSAR